MTKIGIACVRTRAMHGRRTGLHGGLRGTVVQNLRAEFEQNIETLLSRVSKISTRLRQDFAAKYRKPSSKFRLGLMCGVNPDNKHRVQQHYHCHWTDKQCRKTSKQIKLECSAVSGRTVVGSWQSDPSPVKHTSSA